MIKKIIFYIYAHLIGLIKIFYFQNEEDMGVKIKKPIHVKINNKKELIYYYLIFIRKLINSFEINTQ